MKVCVSCGGEFDPGPPKRGRPRTKCFECSPIKSTGDNIIPSGPDNPGFERWERLNDMLLSRGTHLSQQKDKR